MHLQPISATMPAFEANYLRRANITNGMSKVKNDFIDVYSINKDDKDLIQKLLCKVDLQERRDSMAVKEKNNINSTIRYLLNKALNISDDSKGGVYIAVKNNKQVTGMLDYTDSGVPLLKNLIAWHGKDKEITRVNLFNELLQRTNRANAMLPVEEQVELVTYAEPKTKGAKWLKDKGFYAPSQTMYSRERLKMDANTIPEKINENQVSDLKMEVTSHLDRPNVQLKDLQI